MAEHVSIKVGDQVVAARKKAAGPTAGPTAGPAAGGHAPPLIVAIHGGGLTSAYFDCEGYSLLDRASAAGCPSLAIDRPGYGASTPLPLGERAVPRNAELLQSAIASYWRDRDFDASGVVLVGHSIGSTTSLYMASRDTEWPLLGVAFSGLLFAPPADAPPFWKDQEPDAWVLTPAEGRLAMMLGPEGACPPGAREVLDGISQPVWWREIVECYTPWEDEFEEICSGIRAPVHHRHGQLDHLWENGQDQIDRMAAAFTRAPSVDARLVPNTGHCIDFHLTGDALRAEQVAFAIACTA